MSKTIGFIGAGNMAKAIITGIINNKVVEKNNIFIFDIDSSKAEDLSSTFSINQVKSNLEVINNSDYIIIAVKPQSFQELSKELITTNFNNKCVISIMAGVNCRKINKVFQPAEIIRTMPNTPALICKGVTGIYFNNISIENKQFVLNIFNAIGKTIILNNEDDINSVTAISGSGPGYFYYIMETFENLSEYLQISKDKIIDMVCDTMIGSAELLKQTGKTPNALKNMVTSYKGTTAAALDSFNKNDLQKTLKDGVLAAYNRAKELSEE